MEKKCDFYANSIKRVAGLAFGNLLHAYFGNTTLVLEGEGPSGEDFGFAATEQWMEANRGSRFGMNKEEAGTLVVHIEGCSSPQCQEARRRLNAIMPYMNEGTLPGFPEIAIISAFESSKSGGVCRLSNTNRYKKVIEEIRPFMNWIFLDRDFWVWPK